MELPQNDLRKKNSKKYEEWLKNCKQNAKIIIGPVIAQNDVQKSCYSNSTSIYLTIDWNCK